MDEITVQIEVEVNQTESDEKVKKALRNLFGDIHAESKPTQKGSLLVANIRGREPLNTLSSVLRRDHIRDAARKALHHGLKGGVLTFYLNKQAAFAGHASFSEAEAESPLGPIKVTMETNNPLELVDWLAPRTGKP